MLEWVRFVLVALLMAAGLLVEISAVYGNYKFHSAVNRMQTAAMGDTLGILLIVLGLIVASGINFTSLKLLLVIMMLWLSSPVSSHLLSRLEITTDPDLKDKMHVVPSAGEDEKKEDK